MEKQCAKCGAIAREQDQYCMVCGTKLSQGENPFPQQNNISEPDTKPLTLVNYLLMFLISSIPIVNIVMLCIWAFGQKENQNRKNFAKAALIFVGIGTVVGVVVFIVCLQTILYGVAYGIQQYDLYDEFFDYNNHHDIVPDDEWLHHQELLDEAFSTSNIDAQIKQILVHENGIDLL